MRKNTQFAGYAQWGEFCGDYSVKSVAAESRMGAILADVDRSCFWAIQRPPNYQFRKTEQPRRPPFLEGSVSPL